ncbi:MAG: flagellar biosynthesis protein FlgJ [Clostridiaceae bacterium]|jgi:flagellar protein FlgJ|nr:flagellar biosynthesis protein FlgJ [Clostridiaceae bacterium]
MKIEGLGNINPIETVKTNQTQTEASEFESILKKAFDEGDKEKLKEACNEFESIMLQILYRQMKATVPESDFIEKSSARAMFEDMLDEKLMERGSMRGIGISEMMYKQLSAKMDKAYKIETVNEASEPDNTETDGAEPVEE